MTQQFETQEVRPQVAVAPPVVVKLYGREPRLHQLDGLRAVAAMLVVLHHLGAAAMAAALHQKGQHFFGALLHHGTAVGVEMFFVLSGVVLLRPYLRANRPLKIGTYFARRAKRLWPPYVAAWILSGIAVAAATTWPTWWTEGSKLPAFSFSAWVSQIGIVYFGREPMNFAWWSLTVEVMFYLLIPLVVLALRGGRPSVISITTLLLAACAVAVTMNNVDIGITLAGANELHSLLIYASCFAGGIVLAWRDVPTAWKWGCFITGCIYMMAGSAEPRLNVHIGWGLMFTGLVALAMSGGILQRVLAAPILVWLGERSYSWFLTHYAVIGLVCHGTSMVIESKGAAYFLITRAISIPLSLLVAMVLFSFVEKRFASGLATGEAFWPWSVKMK